MLWETKKSQQMQVTKEDYAIFGTLFKSNNLQLFLFSESVDTERDLGSVQEV